MKAMVTTNVNTNLDVANRSQSKVVDIKLDPQEDISQESCTMKLKYPKWNTPGLNIWKDWMKALFQLNWQRKLSDSKQLYKEKKYNGQ